jgi:hypothetical protein
MMAGIAVQWNIQLNILVWEILLIISVALIILFFFIPLLNRYRLHFFNGLMISLLFFSFGGILAWQRDVHHNDQWF